MIRRHRWMRAALLGLLALSALAPAGASTFGRVDLDYLVAGNETILIGEAVRAHSYWNADRSFILTDVTLTVEQVLKGAAPAEVVVTVPGGAVGEESVAVIGSAELLPGRSYLLFLDRVNMLGVRDVLAVHDHGQGAFDLALEKNGEVRAYSQALRHELAPDAAGRREPVGGAQGLPLERLIGSVRELLTGGEAER